MLMNGMVHDEKQREEYIRTLNAEAGRLSRLVGNVLDYSRLERNGRAQPIARTGGGAAAPGRGGLAGPLPRRGKELVIEDETASRAASAPGATRCTDGELRSKILGNLVDNACKYSRARPTPTSGSRARQGGVSCSRWRTAATAYRRESGGRSSRRSGAAGRGGGGDRRRRPGAGVGAELARLLGGELTLRPTAGGACFRLSLPAEAG